MEINLRQRVIGGVVLIALAIIFLPLLFKNHAPRSKPMMMESSIPAAPAKPSMQPTITMQGEEINPQNTAVNSPVSTATRPQNIAQAPDQQLATQPQAISQKPVSNQVAISNTRIAPAKKAAMTPENRFVNAAVPQEELVVESSPAAAATKPAATKTHATQPATKSKPIVTAKKEVPVITVKTTAHVKTKPVVGTTTAASAKHSKLTTGKAWVVQLGSFSDSAKAKTLEKQLRAKGYAAFTRTIKTSAGSMTRVYVGPEIKADKAKTLLAKLDTNMHLKGVVAPFNPTQVK